MMQIQDSQLILNLRFPLNCTIEIRKIYRKCLLVKVDMDMDVDMDMEENFS